MLRARPSAVISLLLSLAACRTPSTTAAPQPAPAAAPPEPHVVPITAAADLPSQDAPTLTVCGALDSSPVGPRGSPSTYVLWGIRLANDPSISLFVRNPWPDAEQGTPRPDLTQPLARVCASGRFYREYPIAPGDPPYTARFSGRWLFDPVITPEPR
ncbi:MAG: hypothetical protein Q8Q09_24005 [Deltaproteobacteria bacterium]|nr:hypothetical protein [Deltaproteobacteria bacterium]